MVEQLPVKETVTGSSPVPGAKKLDTQIQKAEPDLTASSGNSGQILLFLGYREIEPC